MLIGCGSVRSGPFTLRQLTAELARHQDGPARGVGFRSRRGPELQKQFGPPSRIDTTSRQRWEARQGKIDAARLLFIDETWCAAS